MSALFELFKIVEHLGRLGQELTEVPEQKPQNTFRMASQPDLESEELSDIMPTPDEVEKLRQAAELADRARAAAFDKLSESFRMPMDGGMVRDLGHHPLPSGE